MDWTRPLLAMQRCNTCALSILFRSPMILTTSPLSFVFHHPVMSGRVNCQVGYSGYRIFSRCDPMILSGLRSDGITSVCGQQPGPRRGQTTGDVIKTAPRAYAEAARVPPWYAWLCYYRYFALKMDENKSMRLLSRTAQSTLLSDAGLVWTLPRQHTILSSAGLVRALPF